MNEVAIVGEIDRRSDIDTRRPKRLVGCMAPPAINDIEPVYLAGPHAVHRGHHQQRCSQKRHCCGCELADNQPFGLIIMLELHVISSSVRLTCGPTSDRRYWLRV